MFLRSIRLQNFKKFKNKEVKFPADLTVIKGLNETGKSTLVKGLLTGLFKDPIKSLTPKYIEENRAYNSSSLYQIELNFELAGQDFCLQKDFEKKTVVLVNKAENTSETDYQKIKQWLWQNGGYGDQAIFQATACVAQDDLAGIDKKSQALGQVLEDLITSGQNNVRAQDVLRKIKNTYQELTLGLDGRPVKNPGQIKTSQDNISQMKIELKEAASALEQRMTYQVQYQETKTKVKNLKIQLTDKQKSQQEIEDYFGAKKNLDRLEPDFDRVSQILEQLIQIEDKENKVKNLLKIQPKIDEKIIFQFDELTHKKEDDSKDLEQVEQVEPQVISSQSTLLKNLSLLSGGLLVLISLILTWLVSVWFLSTAGLGALLIAFYLIKKLAWQQLTKQEKQKKITELVKRIEALDKKQTKILAQNNLNSRADLVSAAEQCQRLEQQQDDLIKHRKHLLGSRSLADWQKEKQKLARQIAVEQAKIEKEFEVRPPQHEDNVRLKREIADLQEQISQAEKDLVRLETEINNQPWDQEKINVLQEKLANAQTKQERLLDKKDTLILLGQTLKQARALSLKVSLAKIEKYMAEYIGLITDGRYSQIKINEQNLSFSIFIFSPDKKEFVEPSELSRGTIDQLYLVARLAFLQAVSRAARPLVIFDDPFVHTDQERSQKICQLLQNLCRDFQMILLTCHNRYDKWGRVIEL